jgi:hypothetical protein
MIERDDGAVGILKLEAVVHVVQRVLPHDYDAHRPRVQLVLESDRRDELGLLGRRL